MAAGQSGVAKGQSAGGGGGAASVICCCLGGINMTYGQTISLARRAQGYSQEALAEQCGVSRQAVSRWEQGAAYPETEKLILLSRALDLSLDELLLGGACRRGEALLVRKIKGAGDGCASVSGRAHQGKPKKQHSARFCGNSRRGAMADARYPALLDGNHVCITLLRFASAGAKEPCRRLVCGYETEEHQIYRFSDEILQYEIGN